jgi:hypothetical protein
VLVELGKALQTSGGLWLLGFVRIVCGAILIWAAPNSRTPRILIALGILIIVGGLATPFIGVEKTRAIFEWWTSQGSSLARAWPFIAIGSAASSPGWSPRPPEPPLTASFASYGQRSSERPRIMSTNTVSLHRVLRAPPERVYKAFLDGDAMAKWLPPHGFTGKVHHLERRSAAPTECRFTNFGTG